MIIKIGQVFILQSSSLYVVLRDLRRLNKKSFSHQKKCACNCTNRRHAILSTFVRYQKKRSWYHSTFVVHALLVYEPMMILILLKLTIKVYNRAQVYMICVKLRVFPKSLYFVNQMKYIPIILPKWFKSAVNDPTQARFGKGLTNMPFHFSPS